LQIKVIILTKFDELGLSPVILKSIKELNFDTPTPIQEQAIPLILDGHDIMGLAKTGTGKTAAFGLPLVHKLLSEETKRPPKSVRALILAPTRELVNQIATHLRNYVRHTHLRINSVVGGKAISTQIKQLSAGTDILVATPGRLLDLADRRALFLNTAKFLVLDEADQMLDLGFIHDLRKIAKLLGTPRQTLLFSATMPKQVEELSQAYLNDPVKVVTSPPGTAADKVNQRVHFVIQSAKTEMLKDLLIERRDDLSLVFARTKHGAEKLMKHLVACGFSASSIHGNKSQGQRDRAIKAFREGEIRILVATDVAARGIDIPGVSHVYNYDLPEVAENYVHRIGRTARAGKSGDAVAFCKPEDIHLLRAIEHLLKEPIEVASGEPPADENAIPRKRPGRGGGNQSRQGPKKNQANKGKRRQASKAHGSDAFGEKKPDNANPGGQKRPNKHRGNTANHSGGNSGGGRPKQGNEGGRSNNQSRRRRSRSGSVAA
jgi:ATP-dependent RNA helicase RhlE